MDRAINTLQRLNMDTTETDALYERLLTENPGNLIYLEEMLELARKLERERDEARELLRIAVGLLSTQPQFADKHPEDVLAFVKKGVK